MTHSTDRETSWLPLWSIVLAALLMLIVPAVLYWSLPEGPIRVGDTVFANSRHTVPLLNAGLYVRAGYDRTCVLERRDPLVVLWRADERLDTQLRAQVQGKTVVEFPFCPPHAEVVVKPMQVSQRPDLWSDLKGRLRQLFGR